jgi:hypothetical protein
VKPSKIIDHFERKFLKELEVAIAKRAAQGLKNMNIEQSRDQMEDDVEDDEGKELSTFSSPLPTSVVQNALDFGSGGWWFESKSSHKIYLGVIIGERYL